MRSEILILLIVLSLFETACTPSSFCGEIQYKTSFKVSDDEMSLAELERKFGTVSTVVVRNGDYYLCDNSDQWQHTLYLYKDNTIYYWAEVGDTVFAYDAGHPSDSIIDYEIRDTRSTHLGYDCKVLIVRNSNFTRTYHYTSEIPLNPKWHSKYRAANKDFITQIIQSHYLWCEIDFGKFKVISQATQINPGRIPSSQFAIPDGRVLKDITVR